MMKFIKTLSLSTLLLTGCAMFYPQYSGESTADARLKADTEQTVIFPFVYYYNCSIGKIKIHTQILNIEQDPNSNTLKLAQELWKVNACGNLKDVYIDFIPDGQGGTFIKSRFTP
ncbi:hypothetical protein [Avibacterium avium]|uniref:hypothetical protein n=1 Tax=Avibacterium avium TaxID=751 RepID=UPI003BF92226